MLNENLNFKKCMAILNEMAKHIVDMDWDSDGVIYIIIDPEMVEYLEMLLANKEGLEKYLCDYSENWEEYGFDITRVWGAIIDTFNQDIWFSYAKECFYVARWHHRILSNIKSRIRNYKRKFKNYVYKKRRNAYYKKKSKEQLKRIKKLWGN